MGPEVQWRPECFGLGRRAHAATGARLSLVLCLVVCGVTVAAQDPYWEARQDMVRLIETDVRETTLYHNRQELDARVMQAMATVPRHEFVPEKRRKYAYENRPLPIGHGQTISQPFIVALMTDLLNLKPTDRVLEVGTGSAYQAAVLAALVERVYTIEIIRPLGERARETLGRTGNDNVTVRIGDGYYGWQEHAPFDAIIVTAAATHVPPPLLRQLKPGGRMVIPVGSHFAVQQLVLIEKNPSGDIVTRQVLPVSFVPLTGGPDAD